MKDTRPIAWRDWWVLAVAMLIVLIPSLFISMRQNTEINCLVDMLEKNGIHNCEMCIGEEMVLFGD